MSQFTSKNCKYGKKLRIKRVKMDFKIKSDVVKSKINEIIHDSVVGPKFGRDWVRLRVTIIKFLSLLVWSLIQGSTKLKRSNG